MKGRRSHSLEKKKPGGLGMRRHLFEFGSKDEQFKLPFLQSSQMSATTGFDAMQRPDKAGSGALANDENFARNTTYQNLLQSAKGDGFHDSFEVNKSIFTAAPDVPKLFVNLEDAALNEEKLSGILEGLRLDTEVQRYCEDWWEVTEPNTNSFAQISKFFREKSMKKEIDVAQKLETISVSWIQFLAQELKVDKTLHAYFKNLMFYVHQNFLLLIELILQRLPAPSKKNVWAANLKKTVQMKNARHLLSRNEVYPALRHQNEKIVNVLKNTCSLDALYKGIMGVLKGIDETDIAEVRDLMYNALQYRERNFYMPPIDGSRAPPSKKKEAHFFVPQQIVSPSHGLFDEELPEVKEPFLPPKESDEAYTLVLDLDETLVHYFDMGPESHFLVRPGSIEFIEEMSQQYELVIFTAAMQDYADSVLDQIDRNRRIKHRLYRQHTNFHGPVIVKDLSKIGRDLARTIIIDNVSDNFCLQPDNGIFIKTWYDDMNDSSLYDLMPLLRQIATHQIEDVRKALRSFRDQMLRQITAGVQNPHLNL